MTFNEYEEEAHKFAKFDEMYLANGNNVTFMYPALGLAGEAGEAAEKIKKLVRNDKGLVTEEKGYEVVKELGDALWYIMETALQMGYSLEDVAKSNLEKLRDRTARGVICSEGDNR